MNANQIYAHLRAGQFRLAFDELHRGWQSMRWEVRSAIVGTLAGLLLLWAVLAMGWLIGLLAIPLMVGAVIALSRPTPVPSSVDGFVQWADGKRQQAAAKGSFFAKWIMRPFYAGLSGSGSLATPIPDPYLRAGTTIVVQSYAVYLGLAVVSIAVYVVLVLACIALALWILAYMLSDHSSVSVPRSKFTWRSSGRSENRTDIFGDEYEQHLDDKGRPVAYTEQRMDIFGDPYQQQLTQEGRPAGYSEGRQDIFGDDYTQHHGQDGSKSGHSEKQVDMFGDEYVQHYDKEGKPVGRSEERTDIFGDQYTKHDGG